jgi:hypothetical protein
VLNGCFRRLIIVFVLRINWGFTQLKRQAD